ncbi:hypothetical protein BT93_I0061 [Corymbia citriodora subsp. variegata]|nr:hypothetical protein BT93_I0061 [Corymbia citriodora subsp. variegata]
MDQFSKAINALPNFVPANSSNRSALVQIGQSVRMMESSVQIGAPVLKYGSIPVLPDLP